MDKRNNANIMKYLNDKSLEYLKNKNLLVIKNNWGVY